MKPKDPHILAWHFLPAVGRLSHDDPRPVVVGKTLHHKGPVACCESGLHASISLIDALSHRCGSVLCRVECWGKMSTQSDKLAAQHRKCLAMADITPQLRPFAVLCAESALPIFETRYPKDKRPRECIEVTRRYLDGKANIDELRSACAAADAGGVGGAGGVGAYAACAAANAADAANACAADACDACANAAANAAYAAYAACAGGAAANAARKQAREWQEKTLISLLPEAFNAWKV